MYTRERRVIEEETRVHVSTVLSVTRRTVKERCFVFKYCTSML